MITENRSHLRFQFALCCLLVALSVGTTLGQSSRTGRQVASTPRLSAVELRQVIDQTIREEADRYHIDPLLIYALMEQESTFNPRAVSPKGARGLMQLMPGTAARFGVKNPHDPKEAIRAGTKYLVWLMDRFGGNVRLGLAGYNAGEGAVDKFGQKIPPYRETQDYVRRIEQKYLVLARARAAGNNSLPSTGRERVIESKVQLTSYSFRFRVPSTSGNQTSNSEVTALAPVPEK